MRKLEAKTRNSNINTRIKTHGEPPETNTGEVNDADGDDLATNEGKTGLNAGR